MIDTPIADHEAKASIRGEDPNIFSRLEKAKCFINYLDDCANEITDSQTIEHWHERKVSLMKDVERVEESNHER